MIDPDLLAVTRSHDVENHSIKSTRPLHLGEFTLYQRPYSCHSSGDKSTLAYSQGRMCKGARQIMTDPRRYLIRMIIFLAIVASIAALLWAPLHGAFMGNPALNGVILGALFLGVIYVIRQTLRLSPEQRWLVGVQKNGKLKQPNAKPVLLATVYAMLADQNQGEHLSALSLRSVLDGVAARLDEGREISRYMIGLLVFLGLLGTFWGCCRPSAPLVWWLVHSTPTVIISAR